MGSGWSGTTGGNRTEPRRSGAIPVFPFILNRGRRGGNGSNRRMVQEIPARTNVNPTAQEVRDGDGFAATPGCRASRSRGHRHSRRAACGYWWRRSATRRRWSGSDQCLASGTGGLKFRGSSTRVATGCPFFIRGRNRHWRTAASAA